MMAEMGKKKNVKIFSAAVAVIFVLSVAAMAVMQTGNPVSAAPSSKYRCCRHEQGICTG